VINAVPEPVSLPDPDLVRCLAAVPDPRRPCGVRHSLMSLLMTSVAAVLAGARSFTALGEQAADAPPQVTAALGIRRDPLTGRFEPPGEATIRRVLEAADADALDAAVGSWLAARAPGQAGQVVTPDALHTQRETAEFVVTGENAHYILVVKKTSPGFTHGSGSCPGRTSLPVTARTTADTAGRSAAT
jgi:hypothetical protein